jgi:hypothetical protein
MKSDNRLSLGICEDLAFRKQTEEIRAIERQVTDREELTRQQAELRAPARPR